MLLGQLPNKVQLVIWLLRYNVRFYYLYSMCLWIHNHRRK